MPAAVAVPLIMGGVSTAANLYGAKKTADASKSAARTQERAAQEALKVSQQVYNDQRALMAPFANAGQGAATSLQRLLTPGQPYSPEMQAQDAQQFAPGGPPPPSGPPRGMAQRPGTFGPGPMLRMGPGGDGMGLPPGEVNAGMMTGMGQPAPGPRMAPQFNQPVPQAPPNMGPLPQPGPQMGQMQMMPSMRTVIGPDGQVRLVRAGGQ